MNPRSPICPMLSAAAVVFAFAPASAFAQAGPGSRQGCDRQWPTKTAHRTPDGQPDLQGVWSTASVVPLERPKDLGAKEFFTKEEADAYEKKRCSLHEVVHAGNLRRRALQHGSVRSRKGPGASGLHHPDLIDRGPGREESLPCSPRRCRGTRRARRPPRDTNSTDRRIGGSPSNAFCGATKGRPCSPRLQQQSPDCAGPWIRGHPARNDSRRANHPHRRKPAPSRQHPPMVRGLAGALGRRHPGGGYHKLHGPHAVPRIQRKSPRGGTLHAPRTMASCINSQWTIRPRGPNHGAANFP
jgi:hypothetical protein